MRAAEQRRYPRFEAAIHCTLKLREGPLKLVTADVSRHGAFLRTDTPRAERELIQIHFETPSGGVDAMCMVVRAYPAAQPSPRGPGMGVDFFAISKGMKDLWDGFVTDVKIRGHVASPTAVPEAPRVPVDRDHPRHKACFLVRMPDKTKLREFLTTDVSQGGMFLRTPVLREEGEAVELILVHPETHQEYALEGTVVRQVKHEDMKRRGLGIRFESLEGPRLQALTHFIETGVEALKRQDAEERPVQEAVSAATQAPEDAALQQVAGALLLERGDLAGAMSFLTRALLLTPDDASVHFGLARSYRGLSDGRRAEAHERVAKALQLIPG